MNGAGMTYFKHFNSSWNAFDVTFYNNDEHSHSQFDPCGFSVVFAAWVLPGWKLSSYCNSLGHKGFECEPWVWFARRAICPTFFSREERFMSEVWFICITKGSRPIVGLLDDLDLNTWRKIHLYLTFMSKWKNGRIKTFVDIQRQWQRRSLIKWAQRKTKREPNWVIVLSSNTIWRTEWLQPSINH